MKTTKIIGWGIDMKRALLSIACTAGLAVSAMSASAANAPQNTVAASNVAKENSILEGFGHDIPLSFAVMQIVPADQYISYGVGVDQEQLVSWDGGKDWRSILVETAKQSNLIVTFQGNVVRITDIPSAALEQADPGFVMVPYDPELELAEKETQPQATLMADLSVPDEAASSAGEEVVDAGGVPSDAAAVTTSPEIPEEVAPPIDPNNPVGVWRASVGETLYEVLYRWADTAGWTVVYNSNFIYPMQAPAIFNSDFRQATEALVQSVRADVVPLVDFYWGNKSLVISNNPSQIN
ncbi:TcpQ domain-containing protein [Thalassospira xianhensis]|nr:TcpQ domain-containing protein [Thalassospira xianhensis]